MITHKKKQQLIAILIGFLLGVTLSVLVGYFGVIKYFTQVQFEKINQLFPEKNATDTVFITENSRKNIDKTISPAVQDSINEELEESETFIDEIQTDKKIAEIVIAVQITDSTTLGSKDIHVEQWESPMNFVGYRLSKDKLVIYGIDVNEIDLVEEDGKICLVLADNKLALQYSDDFVHFPNSFLISRQNLQNE
ncbi:MAG: hypothetical protein K6F29_06355 [Bacteroidales bacterium]|nr:hypothetical protein [Bacteroidales bacterium]MBQ4477617.1 hypothetical protein [Bacteroidales bacterium]MCR5555135.1 hypothetical protein [Bacteroidales bacterium]